MLTEKKIVTSEMSYLGGEGNLLKPDKTVLHRVQLKTSINRGSIRSY